MPNTVEDLFKRSSEALDKTVRIPLVLSKLAERGYKPETEEQLVELLKLSQDMGRGILSGEIEPIPASALEPDGGLSKHASAAVKGDVLAFATPIDIDVAKLAPEIVKAAAVMIYAGAMADQPAA